MADKAPAETLLEFPCDFPLKIMGLADAALGDVEAVLGWRFPAGVAARLPRLRWVCSVGAGVEKLLVPELGVFASHGTWNKYVMLQTERIEKLLELKSRNTPDCKRVVSAAHDSVLELTRLVEQAYVNMMRYEAQNTINSFKNHGEYAAFMLSLALPSLPKTVEEAQRLSKLQVH